MEPNSLGIRAQSQFPADFYLVAADNFECPRLCRSSLSVPCFSGTLYLVSRHSLRCKTGFGNLRQFGCVLKLLVVGPLPHSLCAPLPAGPSGLLGAVPLPA